MRRFYRSRAARLLPPPPGRAPQTQIQIQLLHPLRTDAFQLSQWDTMILSYSIFPSLVARPCAHGYNQGPLFCDEIVG